MAFCIPFMFCILYGRNTSYNLIIYKQPLITTVCHKNYDIRISMLTLLLSSVSFTLKLFYTCWANSFINLLASLWFLPTYPTYFQSFYQFKFRVLVSQLQEQVRTVLLASVQTHCFHCSPKTS